MDAIKAAVGVLLNDGKASQPGTPRKGHEEKTSTIVAAFRSVKSAYRSRKIGAGTGGGETDSTASTSWDDKVAAVDRIVHETVSNGLNSVDHFNDILSTAIEGLFQAYNTGDSNLRLVCEEGLNTIILRVRSLHLGLLQVELYKELQNEHSQQRSQRLAFTKFAALAHFTQPKKCKTIAPSMFPLMAEYVLRKDDGFQEIVGSHIDKIIKVFGPYATPENIQLMADSCVRSMVESSSPTSRRSAGFTIQAMVSYGPSQDETLPMVLDMLWKNHSSNAGTDGDVTDDRLSGLIGTAMCLKYLLEAITEKQMVNRNKWRSQTLPIWHFLATTIEEHDHNVTTQCLEAAIAFMNCTERMFKAPLVEKHDDFILFHQRVLKILLLQTSAETKQQRPLRTSNLALSLSFLGAMLSLMPQNIDTGMLSALQELTRTFCTHEDQLVRAQIAQVCAGLAHNALMYSSDPSGPYDRCDVHPSLSLMHRLILDSSPQTCRTAIAAAALPFNPLVAIGSATDILVTLDSVLWQSKSSYWLCRYEVLKFIQNLDFIKLAVLDTFSIQPITQSTPRSSISEGSTSPRRPSIPATFVRNRGGAFFERCWQICLSLVYDEDERVAVAASESLTRILMNAPGQTAGVRGLWQDDMNVQVDGHRGGRVVKMPVNTDRYCEVLDETFRSLTHTLFTCSSSKQQCLCAYRAIRGLLIDNWEANEVRKQRDQRANLSDTVMAYANDILAFSIEQLSTSNFGIDLGIHTELLGVISQLLMYQELHIATGVRQRLLVHILRCLNVFKSTKESQYRAQATSGNDSSNVKFTMTTRGKQTENDSPHLAKKQEKHPAQLAGSPRSAGESEEHQVPRSGLCAFEHIPQYMNLRNVLQAARDSASTSLDFTRTDKFVDLLNALLGTLSWIIERLGKAFKLYTEVTLHLLTGVSTLAPTETISCELALLRALYATQTRSKDLRAGHALLPDLSVKSETDSNALCVSFEQLCAGDRFAFRNRKTIFLGDGNVVAESPANEVSDLSTENGQANVKTDSDSVPLDRISQFEPLTLWSVNQYGRTADVYLQCEVIDKMIFMLQIGIDLEELGITNHLVDIIKGQLDMAAHGYHEAYRVALPSIIRFLCLLRRKQHQGSFEAKAIVDLTIDLLPRLLPDVPTAQGCMEAILHFLLPQEGTGPSEDDMDSLHEFIEFMLKNLSYRSVAQSFEFLMSIASNDVAAETADKVLEKLMVDMVSAEIVSYEDGAILALQPTILYIRNSQHIVQLLQVGLKHLCRRLDDDANSRNYGAEDAISDFRYLEVLLLTEYVLYHISEKLRSLDKDAQKAITAIAGAVADLATRIQSLYHSEDLENYAAELLRSHMIYNRLLMNQAQPTNDRELGQTYLKLLHEVQTRKAYIPIPSTAVWYRYCVDLNQTFSVVDKANPCQVFGCDTTLGVFDAMALVIVAVTSQKTKSVRLLREWHGGLEIAMNHLAEERTVQEALSAVMDEGDQEMQEEVMGYFGSLLSDRESQLSYDRAKRCCILARLLLKPSNVQRALAFCSYCPYSALRRRMAKTIEECLEGPEAVAEEVKEFMEAHGSSMRISLCFDLSKVPPSKLITPPLSPKVVLLDKILSISETTKALILLTQRSGQDETADDASRNLTQNLISQCEELLDRMSSHNMNILTDPHAIHICCTAAVTIGDALQTIRMKRRSLEEKALGKFIDPDDMKPEEDWVVCRRRYEATVDNLVGSSLAACNARISRMTVANPLPSALLLTLITTWSFCASLERMWSPSDTNTHSLYNSEGRPENTYARQGLMKHTNPISFLCFSLWDTIVPAMQRREFCHRFRRCPSSQRRAMYSGILYECVADISKSMTAAGMLKMGQRVRSKQYVMRQVLEDCVVRLTRGSYEQVFQHMLRAGRSNAFSVFEPEGDGEDQLHPRPEDNNLFIDLEMMHDPQHLEEFVNVITLCGWRDRNVFETMWSALLSVLGTALGQADEPESTELIVFAAKGLFGMLLDGLAVSNERRDFGHARFHPLSHGICPGFDSRECVLEVLQPWASTGAQMGGIAPAYVGLTGGATSVGRNPRFVAVSLISTIYPSDPYFAPYMATLLDLMEPKLEPEAPFALRAMVARLCSHLVPYTPRQYASEFLAPYMVRCMAEKTEDEDMFTRCYMSLLFTGTLGLGKEADQRPLTTFVLETLFHVLKWVVDNARELEMIDNFCTKCYFAVLRERARVARKSLAPRDSVQLTQRLYEHAWREMASMASGSVDYIEDEVEEDFVQRNASVTMITGRWLVKNKIVGLIKLACTMACWYLSFGDERSAQMALDLLIRAPKIFSRDADVLDTLYDGFIAMIAKSQVNSTFRSNVMRLAFDLPNSLSAASARPLLRYYVLCSGPGHVPNGNETKRDVGGDGDRGMDRVVGDVAAEAADGGEAVNVSDGTAAAIVASTGLRREEMSIAPTAHPDLGSDIAEQQVGRNGGRLSLNLDALDESQRASLAVTASPLKASEDDASYNFEEALQALVDDQEVSAVTMERTTRCLSFARSQPYIVNCIALPMVVELMLNSMNVQHIMPMLMSEFLNCSGSASAILGTQLFDILHVLHGHAKDPVWEWVVYSLDSLAKKQPASMAQWSCLMALAPLTSDDTGDPLWRTQFRMLRYAYRLHGFVLHHEAARSILASLKAAEGQRLSDDLSKTLQAITLE
eukprot:Clim_evm25s134 gene=Clim_evmTU25s134